MISRISLPNGGFLRKVKDDYGELILVHYRDASCITHREDGPAVVFAHSNSLRKNAIFYLHGEELPIELYRVYLLMTGKEQPLKDTYGIYDIEDWRDD